MSSALDGLGDDGFRFAGNGVRGHGVTGRAQLGGGFFEIPLRFVVHMAGAEEVAGRAFEQRAGDEEIDRLGRAGPAVAGDEESLDRPEGARGDEDGAHRGADHALKIAAEMALREIGVFAALPDDDEIAARFEFFERLDERAVALGRGDVGDARGGELLARVVEDRLAFEPRDTTGGLFEFGQFFGEMRAGVHADGAAEIKVRSAFAVMVEDVQDFDARGQALRRPGGMLVNTRRVDRAVGAGEDGRHGAFFLGLMFEHPLQRIGFVVDGRADRRWSRSLR